MEDFLQTEGALAKFDVHEYANSNQLNLETVEARDAYLKHTNKSANIAAELLKRLFRHSDTRISIRLWNGESFAIGALHPKNAAPAFTLVIHHPKVIRLLVTNSNPMLLAQSYFNGDIDIQGDFFAAIKLKDSLSIALSWRDKLGVFLKAISLPSKIMQCDEYKLIDAKNFTSSDVLKFGKQLSSHTKNENKAAVAFHYDVSNEFYALWLDKNMVYSCAYFEHAHMTLEQAQIAKLDHICKKLLLKKGDRFLDIGCGWGALVLHAAKHYGVIAHGITLSQQQLKHARQQIAQAGLQASVTVDLCDYRDIKGEACFDKIASVGMFEHVGLKNLGLYFSCVHALLKPGGLFLNHGITHDVEGWQKTLSTEFINRYIFPDGQLDTVSNISREMERAKFEIADCESLRAHYALTLRQWVARLEQRHEEALKVISESTYRIWRLYMAASALEFEGGELGIYQILAAKRSMGLTKLPLTRRHLYADANQLY
ncbi:MAG: class I SAM-dependent methyltransferase [Bdellovibrio sp.]|nr:class I SAM-dependent methyltransferase [Methylotenera sp.]